MSNSRNPRVYARPFSNDTDAEPMYQRPDQAQEGLDLRTHVAVKALAAIIGGQSDLGYDGPKKAAALAFHYADMFMAEYNRPADEAKAKHEAEVEAGRQLVATAPYLVGGDQRVQAGIGIVAVEYVWDRARREIIAARRQEVGEAEQPWQPLPAERVAAYLGDVPAAVERLEAEIQLHHPYDIEEWGFDVVTDLPEWAQPQE